MPGMRYIYNGVMVENCLSVSPVRESMKYDSTGYNLLGVTKRIHIRGMVHSHTPVTVHGVTPQQQTASDSYRRVTALLKDPRKELYFGYADTPLIQSLPQPNGRTAVGGIYDTNNGPLPQEITARVRGNSIEVEIIIETTQMICPNSGNSDGVLSNTWTVEDAIDQNLYTTRTWTNTLRLVSRDFEPNGPHAFRAWTFPALEKGFMFKSARFLASADGLELHAITTHEQTSHAPPLPATSWRGSSHAIETDEMGITREDVVVHLEGPEGGPEMRTRLMGIAAEVGLAITRSRNITTDGGRQLLRMRLAYPLDQNSVDLHISFRNTGPSLSFAALSTGSGQFGSPLQLPSYDRLKGLPPRAYGTASTAGLLVARLQSPCSNDHGMPPSGDSVTRSTADSTGGGIQVETFEGDVFQVSSSRASAQADATNIYTVCEVESEYVIDMHTVQCPIAKRSSGSGSGGGGAGSQDTSVCIAVAPPTARRIFRMHAERVGAFPELPAHEYYEDGGIKFTPIGQPRIKLASPPQTADGEKKLFAVKLVYEYAMSRAPTPNDRLYIGEMPWQPMKPEETGLPSGRVSTSSKLARP